MNAAVHFGTYALKNIRIDEDANGLIARVPSSDGKYYTVRCVEGKSSVHASHCNCSSFARHQHCTHIEAVARYYGKIYKPAAPVETPVVVEAPVKKVRKARNGLVRKVRGGGLVLVAQPVVEKVQEIATALDIPVAEVEAIAEIAAEHKAEMTEGKHTDFTLPIGPRDTKKDIVRKSTSISTKGNLYNNKGFQILR